MPPPEGATETLHSGNSTVKQEYVDVPVKPVPNGGVSPPLPGALPEPGDGLTSIAWHTLTPAEVCTTLQTGPDGLSPAEAARRLQVYGPNEMHTEEKAGFFRRLWAQINNILIWLLIISSVISAVLQEWADLALIVAVVVINVSIGMVQEGKAEAAAQALKAMLAARATVVRGGHRLAVDASEVVPGDVIFVQSGDRAPADARLLTLSSLGVGESMLTGESLPVRKTLDTVPADAPLGDRKNMLFSATLVQQGQGTAVVTATGDQAEIGRINAMVSAVEDEPTQLQQSLELFGRYIAVATILLAVASFLIIKVGRNRSTNEAFLSSVGIAVALIPEGLPAIVTVALALGVREMAKHNAIIRKLPAVETLGSVTVICSDKTGTLTKNEMTVTQLVTATGQYAVTGIGYAPTGTFLQPAAATTGTAAAGKDSEAAASAPVDAAQLGRFRRMLAIGALCNDGGLQPPPPPPPGAAAAAAAAAPWAISGDPTDVALLTAAAKAGADLSALRAAHPRVDTVPFESDYKFQAVLHDEVHDPEATASGSGSGAGAGGKVRRVIVKGAPERLIQRCKWQVVGDDLSRVAPCDHGYWEAATAELSSRGLRVLAYLRAAAPGGGATSNITVEDIAGGEPWLTLVCLVAILDPPREECVAAIEECHTAGITVKMITGDHAATAKAIAVMLGITDAGGEVLTGPQVDAMADEELARHVMGCNVYARASPEGKIRILTALQGPPNLQIASMTGDGVNDAPALKKANIGVAMGITGSDAAKEAAKMVLVDDSFTSIVVAVKEGRRVWDNLTKLIMVSLPTNAAQGFSIFFAYVIGMDQTPITAMQVLWINMLASVTLGVVLVFEPAEPEVMRRPPRKPGAAILSPYVLFRTLYVTIILVVMVLGQYQWSRDIGYSVDRSRTSALNTLAIAQCFYALSCRFLTRSSLHPRVFRGNPYFWWGILVTVALQALLTYTPGIQTVFNTAFINGLEWLRILALSVVVFLVVEVEKALTPHLAPIVGPPLKRCWRACPRSMRCKPAKRHAGEPPPAPLAMIATSASTFGYPTRPQPLNRTLSKMMMQMQLPSTRRLAMEGVEMVPAAAGAGTGAGGAIPIPRFQRSVSQPVLGRGRTTAPTAAAAPGPAARAALARQPSAPARVLGPGGGARGFSSRWLVSHGAMPGEAELRRISRDARGAGATWTSTRRLPMGTLSSRSLIPAAPPPSPAAATAAATQQQARLPRSPTTTTTATGARAGIASSSTTAAAPAPAPLVPLISSISPTTTSSGMVGRTTVAMLPQPQPQSGASPAPPAPPEGPPQL